MKLGGAGKNHFQVINLTEMLEVFQSKVLRISCISDFSHENIGQILMLLE